MEFPSLGKQLACIREWNSQFAWGMEDHEFERARALVLAHEGVVPLRGVPVLVPYLRPIVSKGTSVRRTSDALMSLFKTIRPDLATWEVRPNLHPRIPDPILGIRLEIIDLQTNIRRDPREFSGKSSSPHAGVLAAACLFPEWVDRIAEESLPGVWIMGYEPGVVLYSNRGRKLTLAQFRGIVGNRVERSARVDLAVPQFCH